MLSSEHRGVRPVVYSSTVEYCALLLHHMMAGVVVWCLLGEALGSWPIAWGADKD